MRAGFPGGLLVTPKPEPCFVDEGGRLKGLARFFSRHFASGETAEFRIDERQQLLGGLVVAMFNELQDAGAFAQQGQRLWKSNDSFNGINSGVDGEMGS